MYQELYDKAKQIIKQHVCMKFYDMLKTLYLEMDVSDVFLGAGFLLIIALVNYRGGEEARLCYVSLLQQF